MEDKGPVGEGGGESPVPEAMIRILEVVREKVPLETVDRIWLFPPLVRGRKEWGLVALSCLTEDPGRRDLLTARYTAELTGQGMTFESELASEGSAPPDRLPRVMDGVVRRSDLQLGEPREEKIGGDPERFQALLLSLGGKPASGAS